MSTDNYDVLGIRFTASQQEIELAYKGRRTQYHPDKYTASDQETITWATEKMKEINKAYAVLSEPTSRAAYDTSLKSQGATSNRNSSTGARSNHQDSPQKTPEARSVEVIGLADLIKQRIGLLMGYERIFLYPNIPAQKFQGAMSSHGARLETPKEVVLVIDDTVFGGAKEGVVITEKFLMVKEIGGSPSHYLLSLVDDISTKRNAIFVNGQKVISLTMTNEQQLASVIACVNEYVQLKKASNKPINPKSILSERDVYFSLQKAKERVKQLYKILDRAHPMFEEVGEVIVNYFETRDEGLKRPEFLVEINEEVSLVFALSDNAIEVMYSRDVVNQTLLEGSDDDSQLVAFLRLMLLAKRQEEMESNKKSRVEKFFE